MWEEDAFVVAAKQIKAVDPTIAAIVWLDSVRLYQQSISLNPQVVGKQYDQMGKLRASVFLDAPAHRRYLLKNQKGGG